MTALPERYGYRKIMTGTKLRQLFFLIGTVLIWLIPVWGSPFDEEMKLGGVIRNVPEPEVSIETLMSGSAQSQFNDYLTEHIPGRPLMVRIRSELSFGLFRSSPNNYYSMNLQGNLFSWGNVSSYMQYEEPDSEEEAAELVRKIEEVDRLLTACGKKLFVFITPCKIRYAEEELPVSDRLLLPEQKKGNYEQLVSALEKSSIDCFDSIAYIEQHTFDEAVPLFQRTNVHWSVVVGNQVGAAFGKYMEENSPYDFPEIEVGARPCEEPVYPDGDAYEVFNLLEKPYDDYYEPVINVQDPTGDHPDVFCRGGSFMGQSVAALIRNDYFGEDVYFENSQIFRNKYSSLEVSHSYEELDLREMLSGKEIVILEVNEASIPSMSFGFIDYLLENPQILEG